MNIEILKFSVKGDERGSLVALEAMIDIPFAIKRVYYIWDTKKEINRGFHAHTKLQQVAICLSGSCVFRLDDGNEIIEVKLDSPDTGLYIKGMIWRSMHDFTPDCVLMVLADEHYHESSYIRNYEEFKRILSAGNPDNEKMK